MENVTIEDEQVDQMLGDMQTEHAEAAPEADIEADVTDRESSDEAKVVPLAALTKMRKRAQEAEQEAQWLRQQQNYQQKMAAQTPPEEDTSQYESATKAELGQSQQAAVRLMLEKIWIKSNPDKYEKVNELLPDFLKQRPNLLNAINSAENRYEEAFTLMEALSPKQQKQIKPAPKKEVKDAPGAPTALPKGAALNQTVDVMNMSDKEFNDWRRERRGRR